MLEDYTHVHRRNRQDGNQTGNTEQFETLKQPFTKRFTGIVNTEKSIIYVSRCFKTAKIQ